MKITVNMAGTFAGRHLNEGLELDIKENTNLEKFLQVLNDHYKTKEFTKKSLKSEKFVMIHNGIRIEPRDLKTKIEDEDTISILEPIMGG